MFQLVLFKFGKWNSKVLPITTPEVKVFIHHVVHNGNQTIIEASMESP
uniref:Uncharacterized protein n=1 Tax=Arundo donax TaxID=35708 RepID=A0A0A8Z141_ARUDO